jgi:hypothetical protein
MLDSLDYDILGCFAEKKTLTSWDIVKKLHPKDTNLNRYLSSVIFRLEKLRQQGFVRKRPHPERKKKSIYDLLVPLICRNGMVYAATGFGGLIIKCRFQDTCHRPCNFGSPTCQLVDYAKNHKEEALLMGLLELAGKNINLKNLKKPITVNQR